jgi:3-hydroxyacyl-CoA dehydrogenase
MQDNPPVQLNNSLIVILGAGSIGVAFAAVFSEAGARVLLVDPDADRRASVPAALAHQRRVIATAGLARDNSGAVVVAVGPDGHLATAALVLECGPENLEIKQDIFAGLLRNAGLGTVLATASSAIPISRIVPNAAAQAHCLVAHPVNPPSVLRVIELVPAPGTNPDVTEKAAQLFGEAGFATVGLGHEIDGFVLNRLQGAVLREAYRLVDEGVTDVAGIDAIMRMGLGPRWALSGPFETAELNTPGGITAHAARMGPAYRRMGESRGETVDWSDDLIARVTAERREILTEPDIPGRVAWRAQAVARLIAARDALMQERGDD